MSDHASITRHVTPGSGMVLLLCLLFLIALTLLGLSASADAILQHQLATNLRETERARQSALAALTWAEDWLLDLNGTAPQICTTACEGLKLHPPGSLLPQPQLEDWSWWQAEGYEAGIDPLSGDRLVTIAANSSSPPMWIIEVIHEEPAQDDEIQVWYRILARGSGQTENAVSVFESTVTRSWAVTSSADNGRVAWRILR
jgi:Tfp pilus assembly protein PilX